jgi:hypothetical protein
MSRESLIQVAAGVNAGYRNGEGERERELGFLFGTTHMVIVLTIRATGKPDDESYSDLTGTISAEIDRQAAVDSYPLLAENGYEG